MKRTTNSRKTASTTGSTDPDSRVPASPSAVEPAAVAPKRYFVDEAGDGVLFNASGKVIVGDEGCSNFFMAGLADIGDPSALQEDFEALRQELLRDPLLTGLRQMAPDRRQTALFFHAKDDPVEVRREVFHVLLRHDVRFSAVVKCKWQVLAYVRDRNRTDGGYRYRADELYDFVLRRLFKQRLHQHEAYCVQFAIRGNKARTHEFREAVEKARSEFRRDHPGALASQIEVLAGWPRDSAGLQAVDYFLWALQRVFERPQEAGCDRYLRALWEAGKVSLVVDADDTRRAAYGSYYTKRKPLTPAALRTAEEYRNG